MLRPKDIRVDAIEGNFRSARPVVYIAPVPRALETINLKNEETFIGPQGSILSSSKRKKKWVKDHSLLRKSPTSFSYILIFLSHFLRREEKAVSRGTREAEIYFAGRRAK